MKKIVATGEPNVRSGLLKRTPRDADAELAHLELAVAALLLMPGAFPLRPSYWRARLRELDGQYALLAPQKARLAALGLKIDAVEVTLATVVPQRTQRRIAA